MTDKTSLTTTPVSLLEDSTENAELKPATLKHLFKELSPDQRGEVYANLVNLHKKVKEALQILTDFKLNTDIHMTGWKVGYGKASRFWTDQALTLVAFKQMGALRGIPEKEFHKLISPYQAEKLFGKDKIEGLTTTLAGRLTVIPEDQAQNIPNLEEEK